MSGVGWLWLTLLYVFLTPGLGWKSSYCLRHAALMAKSKHHQGNPVMALRASALSTSQFNSQNKSRGRHWCQWMREMSGRPLGMGLVERDGKHFRQIGEGTTEGLLGRKICVHDSRVTQSFQEHWVVQSVRLNVYILELDKVWNFRLTLCCEELWMLGQGRGARFNGPWRTVK